MEILGKMEIIQKHTTGWKHLMYDISIYFRNLQNNEMKFEIEELRGYIDIRFEELYDKLTEYIDFNRADSNRPL